MISGYDGADFVAGGVRARGFFEPPCRRDDKLVRRKNQFRWKTLAHLWNCAVKQTGAALALGRENILGAQHIDDVPWLG